MLLSETSIKPEMRMILLFVNTTLIKRRCFNSLLVVFGVVAFFSFVDLYSKNVKYVSGMAASRRIYVYWEYPHPEDTASQHSQKADMIREHG